MKFHDCRLKCKHTGKLYSTIANWSQYYNRDKRVQLLQLSKSGVYCFTCWNDMKKDRKQKQGSTPLKGVYWMQRGFFGWSRLLLRRLRRPTESRRNSVWFEGVTFSINSIQASKSMPKSMKAQSMPSRLYSSCSNTNMWWLKNCCNFSFVKLMQICSKPLN